MAATTNCTNSHATQASAPATGVEFDVVEMPQGGLTADAGAHWLDDCLAISAFFTARQYPSELWQLSSFPLLSTRELVDQVLDKKSLRTAISLELGASIATHCVPAVANILHRAGHQCLCRRSVENSDAEVADRLHQQLNLAIPEYHWHAGATPYARVNYLMLLAEEVFVTLPISWDEAISHSECRDTLRNALKCIAQAVRSANLEPQVMLGAWAAKNMLPDQVSEHQELSRSGRGEGIHEGNLHLPRSSESDESTILSPPDSQGGVFRDDVGEAAEDDFGLLADIQRADGELGDQQGEALSRTFPDYQSTANNSPRSGVRRSRARAPEYDMTRHPVDGTLGDRVVGSRKRKRSQRSEDSHHHIEKRKASPLIIDE